MDASVSLNTRWHSQGMAEHQRLAAAATASPTKNLLSASSGHAIGASDAARPSSTDASAGHCPAMNLLPVISAAAAEQRYRPARAQITKPTMYLS